MKIMLNSVTEVSVPITKSVLDIVSNKLRIEEVSSAGYSIAMNVGDFIKHDATPGTRKKLVHNAVKSVVGEACFSYVDPNYNQLVNALGFAGDTANLRKHLKHIHDQRVKYMKENKITFHTLDERNQRKYCVRPKARKCVYNFSIQKKEHWLTQSLTECSKLWRMGKTREITIS